jgi:hypothetical protein
VLGYEPFTVEFVHLPTGRTTVHTYPVHLTKREIEESYDYIVFEEKKKIVQPKGMSSLRLVTAICRLSELFPDNVVTAIEYEDGSGCNYNYSLDGGKWQFIDFRTLKD